MNRFSKIIAIILAAGFGVAGLAMSLCGGLFTYIAIFGPRQSRYGDNLAFLIVSLPSLIGGAAIIWGAVYMARFFLSKDGPYADSPPIEQRSTDDK
ncbi:MAG: hypothetical protein HY255_01165 [Betaproteobacteria bacterium]|nr:hypothetical protein [Betaproteobacteria bacterium]